MIVPVFPLSGMTLFPDVILPLHIFEMRYRKMIEDLLDTSGRFAVAILDESLPRVDSSPPSILPIGVLGEICGHERLDDGRYLIAVFGIGRVRMTEVESKEPYRKVEISALAETPVPETDVATLRPRLFEAIASVSSDGAEIPEDTPVVRLVDLLLAHLQGRSRAESAAIFGIPDIGERARRTLEAIARRHE